MIGNLVKPGGATGLTRLPSPTPLGLQGSPLGSPLGTPPTVIFLLGAPPPDPHLFAGGLRPQIPIYLLGAPPPDPRCRSRISCIFCWGLRPQTPLQPANSRKIKKSSRWRRFCLRRHRDDFLILIPLKLGVRISRSPPKVIVKVGKSAYPLIARSPIPSSSPRILCPPPGGPHPQTPLAHVFSSPLMVSPCPRFTFVP